MQYILTEKDNMWRGNIDLGNGETTFDRCYPRRDHLGSL